MDYEIEKAFLATFPQLVTLYEQEKNILGDKEMTLYLFFSYVVEPAIGGAISDNDMHFISSIFAKIEELIGCYKGIEDIIICTIFEAYENDFLTKNLNKKMGKKLKKLWVEYCE